MANDRAGVYALAAESAGLGAQADFTAEMDTWAQVDGPVTSCTLSGIAVGPGANSNTAAHVTLALARARRGTQVAAVVLGQVSPPASWQVTGIGADLLGSDLGPLALARQFCTDLARGDYGSAYSLFSAGYRAAVSADQFAAAFADMGGSWTCTPKLQTYRVAGASGTLDIGLSLAEAGAAPLATTETLAFTREGTNWRLAGATPATG
jgi:hypothetical protein